MPQQRQDPRAGAGLRIRERVGAYRQADLEAMGTEELRRVRDWASDQFAAHDESHPDRDIFEDPCRECAYYELLAGAAEDLLLRSDRLARRRPQLARHRPAGESVK